jgi:orotidine-5'-phosphate decarboxylase
MKTQTELIVALDVDTIAEGLALVDQLGDSVTWYKIGKQLFTRFGPEAVTSIKARGKKVFLDLKYHDIPNTVAQAVKSAAAIGADMTNVHASGGPAMLQAAAKAASGSNTLLIAVTVLTSMNQEELAAIGITASPLEQVVRLARLTQAAGVPGIVCSAQEIVPIRAACGPEFQLVVPGIRPAGADHGDQKRVMTPSEAAQAGANYIVVGRPITAAADPRAAALAILRELAG